jgi:deoxyadenosine/deoxycytidine kinase
MTIITIDGNIGAGKSTVLKYLKHKYNYSIDLEPVDDWLPFLHDVYKNNKDAFELQMKVWTDRMFDVFYPPNEKTLVERSGHFQWNVFTKYSLETGKITDRQYNILKTLYEKAPVQPDAYIYLRTTPEETFNRIHKRNRNCESDIDLPYIEKLHDMHENAYQDLLDESLPYVYDINVENLTPANIAERINAILLNLP